MALRDFTDSSGGRWRVWNVSPHILQGLGADIPDEATPAHEADAEHRTQRRLVPGLEGGWLCFENQAEKRRLNPIPTDWERLPELDLQRLLGQARPVTRRFG